MMASDSAHVRTRTVWGALLGVVAALVLTGGVAMAAPPGNNGTVKIHDGTGEPAPEIRNEPHVGCPFHLHFFFSDPEQSGTWWIESWPPGGDMSSVISGSYAADSTGEAWVGPLSLDPGHYKLFWEGDESKLLKHKTFWVTSECEGGLPGEETPTPFNGAAADPRGSGGGTATLALVVGAGSGLASLLFLRPLKRRATHD